MLLAPAHNGIESARLLVLKLKIDLNKVLNGRFVPPALAIAPAIRNNLDNN